MRTLPRPGFCLLALLSLGSSVWAAAPVFQRSDAVGLSLGQEVDYRLVAIGDGLSYTAQGLPTGVVIDTGTGRIHGTPTDVGTYRVAVNATNADGTASATLTLSVVAPDAAPLIYAPLTFDAYSTAQPGGNMFTCALKATGTPTSYQATGSLPAGWTFNNGSIVGGTSQPGQFLVPVSATNTYGTGSAAITVRIHPACTGLQQSTGDLKSGDTFTVTLQFNRPVSFSGAAPYLEFHTYPDSGTKRLAYVSGNGTTTFVFSYSVSTADTPGDVLLYTTIQPAAGSEVSGLADSDGLALGAALPVYGPSTPAARIVASASAPSPAASGSVSSSSASTASSSTTTVATNTSATSSSAVSPPSAPTSSTGSTASTAPVGTIAMAGGTAVASSSSPTASTTNASTSAAATSSTSTDSTAGRLVNLSARGLVTDGDSAHAFIAGFVVSGTAPKHMLVRAVGPALSPFGVTDALPNPQLRVLDGTGHIVAQSDDWSGTSTAQTATQVGAFALPAGSRDAALDVTLPPGNYSMQVMPNGGSGVALAELYDADASDAATPLINISTRGYVAAGDGVLTAGFVVAGNSPKKLLIRGVGPTLAGFSVSDPLADPTLKVFQGNAVVAQNNDWQSAQVQVTPADVAAAAKAVGAFDLPSGSHDAATIVTLAPGTYTAVVSSTNETSGAAMVEVYEVPAQ